MTRNLTNDAPTLRLVTLRRLLGRREPPMVFDTRTIVSLIARALATSPATFAAIVDAASILRGTLCLADLADHDPAAAAEVAMVTLAPIMRPEDDVEDALLEMMAHAADRVLVVDSKGILLGVLTERDLMPDNRAA